MTREYYGITKRFKFEASHRLFGLTYDTPCKNFHGHSYKVDVMIMTDSLDENGMVIDFSKLKFFQAWLDDNFDHACILHPDDPMLELMVKSNNSVYAMEGIPTAEHMAKSFCDVLLTTFEYNGFLSRIKQIEVSVMETDNNHGVYVKFL